jgi:hypothetical protein
MASSEALPTVDFRGWHEHLGAMASEPLSVAGHELVVIFVAAEMGVGDRLEAWAEGLDRSGSWQAVGEKLVMQNPMKLTGATPFMMEITLNRKMDSFEQIRIIWKRASGNPRNVTARAGLRRSKAGAQDSEQEAVQPWSSIE